MNWLRPSSLAVSCRRLVAVAGLRAAGVLLSTGVAQADESTESALLGSVAETVESVSVDEALEETTDVVIPVIEEVRDQVADLPEPVVAPVEAVSETVVEPVAEPLGTPTEAVTETVVVPVVETVEPVTETVVEPVVETVEPVVQVVSPVVEPVTTPVIETVDEVVDATEPLTGPVAEQLAPVAEPVTTVLEPVVDVTEDVEIVELPQEVNAPVEDEPAPAEPVTTSSTQDDIDFPGAIPTGQVTVDDSGAGEATEAVDERAPSADVATIRPVLAAAPDEPAPLLQLPSSPSSETPTAAGTTDAPAPPAAAPSSPDSPAQAGTCAPGSTGSTARAGLDGWADDLTWLDDVRKGDLVERTDSRGPRDPYRDIPTSPA